MYRLFFDTTSNGGYLSPLTFSSITEAEEFALSIGQPNNQGIITDADFSEVAQLEV